MKWERDWLKPSASAYKPISDIPGLKGKLFPFQAEGVGFIESRGGRALLGDEMGLGKTIQALAWLKLHQSDALPALIVCPASLKMNWVQEIRNWTDFSPFVVSGRICRGTPMGSSVYVINYDILKDWLEAFESIKFQTVILDESHFIKSPKTLRTKAVKQLCKGKKHIIALSGTPIINRPIEFFTALNILAPINFGKYWDYAMRYCDGKHNGYGWDFSGSSRADELHERASTVMIRRMKADVMKDLPEKTRSVIPLELGANEGIYLSALREALGSWQDEKPDPLKDIAQISKLRQAAMEAKFDLCHEWIDNFLETGKKLVVFVVHHKTTDKLMESYKDIAITLDGRVDSRLRSKVVERFQTDPAVKLLIGNIQVAGTGFTLTAASDVVFLEYPWTSGELDQATDRVHRIGQKNAVTAYYLIAQGTLEEDMIALIDEKRKVVGAVLNGIYEESAAIMKELVKRLKERNR
jgi:SWI/SNF-related matrix-associated actin-dependent regulator 1 of chromatin subfamily A